MSQPSFSDLGALLDEGRLYPRQEHLPTNEAMNLLRCYSGPKVQHDYIATAKDSNEKIRTI
jgi:hypothetical protein